MAPKYGTYHLPVSLGIVALTSADDYTLCNP